jgi:hypothetical protein
VYYPFILSLISCMAHILAFFRINGPIIHL